MFFLSKRIIPHCRRIRCPRYPDVGVTLSAIAHLESGIGMQFLRSTALGIASAALLLTSCGEKEEHREPAPEAQSQAYDPETRAYFGPLLQCANVTCLAEARKAASEFIARERPAAEIKGMAAREIDDVTWLVAVDIGEAHSVELIVRWFVTAKTAAEKEAGDYWRAELLLSDIQITPGPASEASPPDEGERYYEEDRDRY